MICKTDISNVKTDIFDRVGQKIIVKGSLGRCKEFKKEGTLEKAYSNLFINFSVAFVKAFSAFTPKRRDKLMTENIKSPISSCKWEKSLFSAASDTSESSSEIFAAAPFQS